jgi:nucleoside phosphorylase
VIAITFALPVESAPFIKTLRDKQRERIGELEIVRGKIDNRGVEVLHTGVGEKICRHRMARFLQDRSAAGRIRPGEQFELLISAGFAGAIGHELKIGDVVIAQNFSSAKIAAASLPADFPVRIRDIATSGHVIDSAEDRLRLAQTIGAAAVDMETEFIARACAEHGLPMLSLRAISDTPARPLPFPPHVLFDIEQQRTRATKLSLYLLTHPARMARMISFIRQVRAARRSLTRALEAVLESEIL